MLAITPCIRVQQRLSVFDSTTLVHIARCSPVTPGNEALYITSSRYQTLNYILPSKCDSDPVHLANNKRAGHADVVGLSVRLQGRWAVLTTGQASKPARACAASDKAKQRTSERLLRNNGAKLATGSWAHFH